jgi:TetR/AcrR family tetracycline transcriptional repressor
VKSDLSRAAIVDRALLLADEIGLEAITVRRLAQEFDVTAMALYWHVKNKDELLAAMGDWFFEELPDFPSRGTWSERLRAVIDALVGSLRRHPESAALAAPRVLSCDPGRELAERTLGMLREAGFSIAEATDIARTAMQTAIMLVTEMAGAEPGIAIEHKDEVRAQKRRALAALPPDRFPNLIACAAAFTECEDEDAYYAFGLDLFVSGVQRLHAGHTRHNREHDRLR